jgi:hypothetical protein
MLWFKIDMNLLFKSSMKILLTLIHPLNISLLERVIINFFMHIFRLIFYLIIIKTVV